MALNRYRLADQAAKKNRRAILLQNLLDEPDRLLGTILLGNNLVNNAAVAITTMLAWKFYGEAGVAVATGIITIVILVLAEIPPKTFAALYPEKIAYFASFILNLLQKLLFPFVWILSAVVKLIKMIPIFNQQSSSNSLDSDALRHAVKASEQHFEKDHLELLLGILDLGSQSVESVMVPRSEIHAIDLDDEISDIIEQILKETHARLPVLEKSFVTLHELLSQFAGIIGGPIENKIPGIVPEEEGSFLVNAAMSVRDLNRLMKWNLPTAGPITLNGLIIEQNEDIPQPGMDFHINGHKVETVRVRGTAVDVARVYPIMDSDIEDEKSGAPTAEHKVN